MQSVKKIQHAKPGRHGDGNGLYLLVRPTESKSGLLDPSFLWRQKEEEADPTFKKVASKSRLSLKGLAQRQRSAAVASIVLDDILSIRILSTDAQTGAILSS